MHVRRTGGLYDNLGVSKRDVAMKIRELAIKERR
jgi:hypothetical protein